MKVPPARGLLNWREEFFCMRLKGIFPHEGDQGAASKNWAIGSLQRGVELSTGISTGNVERFICRMTRNRRCTGVAG